MTEGQQNLQQVACSLLKSTHAKRNGDVQSFYFNQTFLHSMRVFIASGLIMCVRFFSKIKPYKKPNKQKPQFRTLILKTRDFTH